MSKRNLIACGLAAALVAASLFLGYRWGRNSVTPDTVIKTEYKTIRVKDPMPALSFNTGNVIFVPVLPDSTQNDTTDHLVLSDVPTASPDSIAGAYVEIPITQQEYRDTLSQDGVLFSYDIGISGYRPNLEYANFSFPQSVTNTTVIQKESPRIKFDWGLQGGFGYGLINGKADIYVGIGCTIHF